MQGYVEEQVKRIEKQLTELNGRYMDEIEEIKERMVYVSRLFTVLAYMLYFSGMMLLILTELWQMNIKIK